MDRSPEPLAAVAALLAPYAHPVADPKARPRHQPWARCWPVASDYDAEALRGEPTTSVDGGSHARSLGCAGDIISGMTGTSRHDGAEYGRQINLGDDRKSPMLDVAVYRQAWFHGNRVECRPPTSPHSTNRDRDLTRVGHVMTD